MKHFKTSLSPILKNLVFFFNIFEHWFMIKNKEFLVGDDPWFWRKYRKREKTMKL